MSTGSFEERMTAYAQASIMPARRAV